MLSRLTASLVVPCLLTGCAANAAAGLADKYNGHFLIGTAVKSSELRSTLPAKNALVCREFNAFTAENAMKWQHIQPEPGVFSFAMADQLIRIAEQCNGKVIGHTLVWHQQT
ncbi:MAG TPA: endo-1,4-beta-xylanase, partial [Alteromonas sp.]|nr:endo-1,4-beta-xylanase [Alteromonas sp.]